MQGSFLDGKAGVQTAWIAAFYSFNKQARLWTINHGKHQTEPDAVHFSKQLKVENRGDEDPYKSDRRVA